MELQNVRERVRSISLLEMASGTAKAVNLLIAYRSVLIIEKQVGPDIDDLGSMTPSPNCSESKKKCNEEGN
jgi:hypothetical protein